MICTKSLSLWKGYSQYECPLNYKLSKTTTLKKIRWATWNQNFEYVDKLISLNSTFRLSKILDHSRIAVSKRLKTQIGHFLTGLGYGENIELLEVISCNIRKSETPNQPPVVFLGKILHLHVNIQAFHAVCNTRSILKRRIV